MGPVNPWPSLLEAKAGRSVRCRQKADVRLRARLGDSAALPVSLKRTSAQVESHPEGGQTSEKFTDEMVWAGG